MSPQVVIVADLPPTRAHSFYSEHHDPVKSFLPYGWIVRLADSQRTQKSEQGSSYAQLQNRNLECGRPPGGNPQSDLVTPAIFGWQIVFCICLRRSTLIVFRGTHLLCGRLELPR